LASNDQNPGTAATEATATEAAEPSTAPEQVPAAGSDGLELQRVTKQFGDVVAVEDVNLHIGNGEYVVLLGPSGCGKTTILRMIGGHEHPSSGDIRLDGRSLVGEPPAKRPTTTVFQHFALFPHRSVLGNVEFGLRMQGMAKDERRKRALEMIDLVGLSEMRFRKPSELSGGQQQRVALARVLVTKPKLLLLDEPFGDLDRLLQLRMRVELRELQRELGIAFIHVTHNQEEALSMADRIVVMEGGHIQQVGHPAEISQRPANVFVAAFMGDNNILQGSVKDAAGGEVVIDSALGPLKMAAGGAAPSVGEAVTVAVRANSVRVAPGSGTEDPNQVTCTLAATEYLGDTIKVHMRAGEHPLMAKLPEQRYPELASLKDKSVVASWDAADVQLLRD
jgi:ABC-type Fe3+/spermidine/putrescine transport system ATPase subunit